MQWNYLACAAASMVHQYWYDSKTETLQWLETESGSAGTLSSWLMWCTYLYSLYYPYRWQSAHPQCQNKRFFYVKLQILSKKAGGFEENFSSSPDRAVKEEKSILVAPKSSFSQTAYNFTSKYPCYAHFKPILKATQASRIIAVK